MQAEHGNAVVHGGCTSHSLEWRSVEVLSISLQAAMEAASANKGPPPGSNGLSGNGHATGLLHPGAAMGPTNGYGNTAGHLHQGGAAPGGVEMARY
jgi:hypothetical protein